MVTSVHHKRYAKLRSVLKDVRKNAGLTQIQLAQRLHMEQSNLSKIERGERYLDVMLFIDYCHVADFERSLIIERVQAGLARAKAENKKLGRPSKTSASDQQEIIKQLAQGVTVSQLARDYAISRASVIKIRERVLSN